MSATMRGSPVEFVFGSVIFRAESLKEPGRVGAQEGAADALESTDRTRRGIVSIADEGEGEDEGVWPSRVVRCVQLLLSLAWEAV
jgi:hypothetical protein